jgi:Pyruvate/2-oxoacid:ferredoxin oxidoreductase delta subunit
LNWAFDLAQLNQKDKLVKLPHKGDLIFVEDNFMKKKNSKFSLISPSTKALYQEGKAMKDYSFWDFIHGYVYGRWPYLYIGIGKGEHPHSNKVRALFRVWGRLFPKKDNSLHQIPSVSQATGTTADGYHGKVTPLDLARQLVTINEPITIEDLEQVIPYVRARAIIQENPDKIIAIECPCRSVKDNPCLPLDVCLIVGEPFASFVIDHHPDRARWITQEDAIQILVEEDARGHVHHAFFKDAMLGRFYAICNCCTCCCGAMKAHQNGTPMLASSGFVAQVDEDLCISCESCSEYCQFGALTYADDIGHVNEEDCMGCGICVDKCSEGAITIHREPSKGIPLEIFRLLEGVGK